MNITKAKFNAIEKLLDRLHQEQYDNAQGDNGYDIEIRRERYRKQLEKLLARKRKAKR